ncbi:MAG: dethiobiotin synthase [Methylococcales bacterium]
MIKSYFITGTDTDVGKTWATIALMRYFKQQGYSVVGMKPVAAGCRYSSNVEHEGGEVLRNADALLMQANASIDVAYELVNPYAYSLPASPHIAGVDDPVNLAKVVSCFDTLKSLADIVLVEGVGGWYAPINQQEDISDLAKKLALPIILVVGIKLGCINHAKLSYQVIQQSGLECAGWIAACIDGDMLFLEENIETIKAALSVPLLGVLPYLPEADFDLLADRIVFG